MAGESKKTEMEFEAEGGVTRHYVNRYYEYDVTNTTATIYYWFGDQLVAVKKGTALSYVHTDSLGSTSVTTDSSGALATSETYFPYGTTRTQTGTLPTEKQFTGQRLDSTGCGS